MMANTVEDPNHDPNLYSEIDLSYCTPPTTTEDDLLGKGYQIYRIRSQMKYSLRICEAMNTSSCMTSWDEMSSKESA